MRALLELSQLTAGERRVRKRREERKKVRYRRTKSDRIRDIMKGKRETDRERQRDTGVQGQEYGDVSECENANYASLLVRMDERKEGHSKFVQFLLQKLEDHHHRQSFALAYSKFRDCTVSRLLEERQLIPGRTATEQAV
jgi:hypothetical protein